MSLSLNGVSIRQDVNGLYSLGDLFRASGGTHGKQPSFWLENRQPNSIAEKLKSNTGIPVLVSKHGGRNPGTYACYELVIMYSAWLNDDFHIDVLQAFKALMRGDSTTAQGIADRAFLRDEYKELTESSWPPRSKLVASLNASVAALTASLPIASSICGTGSPTICVMPERR